MNTCYAFATPYPQINCLRESSCIKIRSIVVNKNRMQRIRDLGLRYRKEDGLGHQLVYLETQMECPCLMKTDCRLAIADTTLPSSQLYKYEWMLCSCCESALQLSAFASLDKNSVIDICSTSGSAK
jgi:hypothetical protein